jgi:2-methylisocitrate lyase-like PEP mutase family enzyme
MYSSFETFKALHHSPELFLLPNAWDAKSAALFQEKKFSAIATSSAAVAGSLGYGDGEQMPFYDYMFVIKRIMAAVQVPVTIDMEMGYGKTDEEIASNVLRLADIGIAGINIEDSSIETAGRILKDAKTFANTVEHIKNRLASKKQGLFVNIRCDTYILNVPNKQQETKRRLKIYEATGADGIFLPCITSEDDIADATNNTALPLNVMCIPGLPAFDALRRLGVKRVSMGPFMFHKVYNQVNVLSDAIATSNSISPIL